MTDDVRDGIVCRLPIDADWRSRDPLPNESMSEVWCENDERPAVEVVDGHALCSTCLKGRRP